MCGLQTPAKMSGEVRSKKSQQNENGDVQHLQNIFQPWLGVSKLSDAMMLCFPLPLRPMHVKMNAVSSHLLHPLHVTCKYIEQKKKVYKRFGTRRRKWL